MQDTIDLGTRRELLVDDFLIARMQGVHLQLQHRERREVAFALRLDPRLSPLPAPPNSAETVFVVNWKSAAKVVFTRGAESSASPCWRSRRR